jgi:plastocyanin
VTPAVTPAATPRTISVVSGQELFSPQNLGNINLGDSITWLNNDTHDVVSADIPVGATPFASPFLSGSAATFTQTFTVPGTYRYYCTLHAALGDANATLLRVRARWSASSRSSMP